MRGFGGNTFKLYQEADFTIKTPQNPKIKQDKNYK